MTHHPHPRPGRRLVAATALTALLASCAAHSLPSAHAAPTSPAAPAASPTATTTFIDVRPGTPFHDEITWLAHRGISTGWTTPAGNEFRPTTPVARDAMAAFLYRMAGSPAFTPPRTSPFTDVAPTNPFYREITWLHAQGLTRGWTTSTGVEFRPLSSTNRDAMAAFLYRRAGSPAFTPPTTSPFRDVAPGDAFYREVTWLASEGVSTGWTTAGAREFRPTTPVHRDAMAAFLFRSATATATIPPSGGAVELPGVGRVTFPDGSFTRPTQVTVSSPASPRYAALFAQDAESLYDASTALTHQFRVVVGTTQPARDVTVALTAPDTFRDAVPSGSEVRLFAGTVSAGDDDEAATLEPVSRRYAATDRTVTATLGPQFFVDDHRTDDRDELIVSLATTPTAPLTQRAADTIADADAPLPHLESGPDAQTTSAPPTLLAARCEGVSIGEPLSPMPSPSSGFTMARKHPISGKVRPHYGTDYGAPKGTPIHAVADGRVQFVGTKGGYGKTLDLRHDGGGATRYAHLDGYATKVGQSVRKGDVIAYVGNTGGSTNPHLHLEYAPDGQIGTRGSRVDPAPCIGDNVPGSITIRDNGNLADDAFAVSIDGRFICQTSIGARNSCSVGTLRKGVHSLSVGTMVAPDNVGTWEITLSDGLTFLGGGTYQSGTSRLGETAGFLIVAP